MNDNHAKEKEKIWEGNIRLRKITRLEWEEKDRHMEEDGMKRIENEINVDKWMNIKMKKKRIGENNTKGVK